MRRRAVPQQKKIVFIAPFFEYHPIIASCMITQLYQNWELYLIHDGPCPELYKSQLAGIVASDERIKFIETPIRTFAWGHYIRHDYLVALGKGEISPDAYAVVITNGDNYHCPGYCTMLMAPFENEKVVATYHDILPHNYMAWAILPHALKLGNIDVCQMVVRKDVACAVGWNDMSHSSDWPYMSGIIKGYGEKNMVKVSGCLSSHN